MAPNRLPCPHVHGDKICPVPSSGIDVQATCKKCHHVGGNYVCLTCYEVFCGWKSGRNHMRGHMGSTGHPMGLNLSLIHMIRCFHCSTKIRIPDEGYVRDAFDAAFYNTFGKPAELPSLEDKLIWN